MYSLPWRTLLAAHLGNPDDVWVPDETWREHLEHTEEEYKELMEASGFRENAAGDLEIFVESLGVNVLLTLAAFVIFSVLRRYVPEIYSNNCRSKEEGGLGTAPFVPSDRLWGWWPASLKVTLEEAWKTSGLDAALMLEFTDLCTRMSLIVGLPLVFILCPLHAFAGGDRAGKKGDNLSRVGLNNVVDGSPMFYVHVLAVWYVVIVVEHMIYKSMARFLELRFQWLQDFTYPQATTVLVENIPPAYRSDKALSELYNNLFPNSVSSVSLVKDTTTLKPLVEKLKKKDFDLEVLIYKKEQHNEEGDRTNADAAKQIDAEIDELMNEVHELQTEVEVKRARIQKAAEKTDPANKDALVPEAVEALGSILKGVDALPVNTASGFVTFVGMREALTALHTRCSADRDEFVMSLPPQPSDIIYEDLMRPLYRQRIRSCMGFGCLFLLFWGFMPFVMVISSFTNLEALSEHSTDLRKFLTKYPSVYGMLEGFCATLALVLMMSFLPTLLMLIFENFFTIRARAWAQLKVQRYYFFFLVTFVLLTTALGHSLVEKAIKLYQEPQRAAKVLADALPLATHFYLDYMLVEIMQLALGMTRYIQLAKFWSYKVMLGRERAIDFAEPEDQDFYGMGARCARESLDIVIALVFCTLCPLITVLTALKFFFARLTYGYLVVFAETRKADLGGPFFVELLRQVQTGLLLYVALMLGIFIRRAQSTGPVFLALPALPYVLWCAWRFETAFLWETLPMMDIVDEEAIAGCKAKIAQFRKVNDNSHPPYTQTELIEGKTPRVIHSYRSFKTDESARETGRAALSAGSPK